VNVNWAAWTTPTAVKTLVGALVALIGVVVLLGYTLFFRVPDVEQHVASMNSDVHEHMNKMNEDLRDQLKAMNGDVHDQLSSMKLSLAGVRANVMLLCGQKRQICDVRQLVAEAKSVTHVQAEFFGKGDLKLTAGATPAVTSKGVVEQLPTVSWGTQGVTTHDRVDKTDNPDLANVILWSSAADSARWHQEGNTVKVHFKNGDASFEMKHAVSKEHMKELIDSLNATSMALQKADGKVDK